jgi:hypothetical protein
MQLLAALRPRIAALAADEAAKEGWPSASERTVAESIVEAAAEAIEVLTSGAPPDPRCLFLAMLLPAAAPPGIEASVRAALKCSLPPATMQALAASAVSVFSAFAASPGSACAVESLEPPDALWRRLADTACPSPLPQHLLSFAAARLHRAAGLDTGASQSSLPVAADWCLAALAPPPPGSEAHAAEWAAGECHDGDAVTLAEERQGALLCLLAALAQREQGGEASHETAAVRLRLLWAVFSIREDGDCRVAGGCARRAAAALTDSLTTALAAEAASIDSTDSTVDDPDAALALTAATSLAETFGDASFGDQLHARHVALALRRRAPPAARAAALRAVLERRAARLLPPLSCFPSETLFLCTGGERSAEAFGLFLDFACSPDWARARAAGSMLCDLARHAMTQGGGRPTAMRRLAREGADEDLRTIGRAACGAG